MTDTVSYLFEGDYVAQPDQQDAQEVTISALIAAAIPVEPPARWFDNPQLTGPCAITVEDNGRVYGHCAAWHVSHIGMPFNTKPPHSRNNYAYFHTGVVRCAEGKDVTVGQLTLSGGHAGLEMSAQDTIRHYDDTRSAIADVHLGEDKFGIWVAGALRPGATPEQIRALRASKPSGDWRPINGRLELVAVLQVNVPGFPVTRAHVASGYVTALVAAGAAAIAQLRGPTLDQRLERIERALSGDDKPASAPAIDPELLAARQALSARVHGPEREKLAALAAAAHQRMQETADELSEAQVFADYSTETRQEYARKGWAMPDGSYPIANGGDLARAIRAYGRSAPGDKAKVRRHIMRRARGLGKADKIPANWLSVSIEERAADARAAFLDVRYRDVTTEHAELSARFAAVTAALKYRGKKEFEEKLHPRDDAGMFRDVLLRLKRDVEGKPGAEQAIQEMEAAQRANDANADKETEDHISNIIKIVDQVAAGSVDPDTAKTLRDGNTELGKFISGTPLPAGIDADKMRYSDLAPQTQELIELLVTRLKGYVDEDTYNKATKDLLDFKRGGDVWNASELLSAMSTVFRYLLGPGNSEEQVKAAEEQRKRETGS